MKTKILYTAIIFLFGMVNLPALQPNPLGVVKDIAYISGPDFAQIHLKTDQMIPIPSIFYPDKNDSTLIVMRLNNIDIQLSKSRFSFDSPVVDTVQVIQGKTYIDVEIRLKQQATYRLFTNQKGLFVEFPGITNSQNLAAAASTSPSPQPTESTAPPENENENKSNTNTTGNQPVITIKDDSPSSSGETRLKDVVITEKAPHRIKFSVILDNEPDFEVIPIPNEPVRLAIDFKNTRAKIIKKAINLLNVKGIRGALNSSSIYRLVFDLTYLKEYKVAASAQNSNTLEVEFFDTLLPKENENANKPTESVPTPAPSTDTEALNAETSETQQGKEDSVKVKPGNPDVIVNEDFFEDEKSQVPKKNTAVKQPEQEQKQEEAAEQPQTSPKETTPQQGEASTEPGLPSYQPNYQKKTIDAGGRKYRGIPMTFNFHNADLKDVIKIVSKISNKNVIFDSGIAGRVTSQMTDVPWDQALDLFLKINGLDYVEEGNILRIGKVEQLAAEANERRRLLEAKQMEGDLSVFTRTLSFAKVGDVAALLRTQLTQRGKIMQDVRSNTLIISEVPSRIEVLEKLIDTLDTPNPQVSIEARVVETRTNFIESLGIQWGYNFIADASHGNQTTLKFPNSVQVAGNQFRSVASPLLGPLGGYAVNLPATGASAGTLISVGNIANTFRLDMALSAMQSQGDAKIISSPKTTTQNNQLSTVMQGKMIPVQTIQNNTITVVYRPAALELKVTPQITAQEKVICKLEIENNDADFANLVNGIPPILTQSIKTTVMVDNGGTIVIGGMYKVEKSSTKNGVPFLSKIPILGSLFKSKSQKGEQKEILIFITPRILK